MASSSTFEAEEATFAVVDDEPTERITIDDEATTARLSADDARHLLQLSRPAALPGLPPRRLASGTLDGVRPNPSMLGGYRIDEVLASGGMGVVYRAVHPVTGQQVAIKALHEHLQRDPAIVGRFFAESAAVARLSHPNVVRFFDFGADDRGAAYLVMELIEGETLRARLAREPRLALPVALEIATQIGMGLAAAHKHGVIHRDLKPDNIMLALDPAEPGAITVKLLDFGVAKLPGLSAQRTSEGALLGTPAYMAPEQGRSAAGSDARSDLYSVGCMLFEMVCGVVPFAGSLVETLVAHQTSDRPEPRALNAEIPADLEALIDRLIALDPAERPQSSIEMVCALRDIAERMPSHTSLRPRHLRLHTEQVGYLARRPPRPARRGPGWLRRVFAWFGRRVTRSRSAGM